MSIHKLLDKIFLSPDAWWMRIIWTRWTRSTTLWVVRHLPIKRGRGIFVSRAGFHYSCNPRVIAEYIIEHHEEYSNLEPWFSLHFPNKFREELPKGLGIVVPKTLKYYYIYSSSQFIISNQLTWDMESKRSQQLYIQTLHGGHGIKKFGLDCEISPNPQRPSIEQNALITDLVLSDSAFFSNIIRSACGLSCEILQKGLPRNDIFFSSLKIKAEIRNRLLQSLNLPKDIRYLIYAPTYRDNWNATVYGFDTISVLASFEKRFGGKWYLLVSSHPYMLEYYNKIYDFENPRVIDVGQISDVQDLLITGDALITDYSSIEMDFSLTGNPVFVLAKDWRSYNRGTYLDIKSLPFPFADNDETLCENILNFDSEKYKKNLEQFNKTIIGLSETGYAAKAVADWMLQKSTN